MELLELVFDPIKHEYSYGGILLPSVTQITGFLLGINFDGVPADILKRASDRGTLVHSEVEQFESSNKSDFAPYFSPYFEEYLKLKSENSYRVIKVEQKLLSLNGIVDFAGTYDQVIEINGQQCIADVKTTSQVHHDSLKIQLSLYSYALGLTSSTGYCIWLRKNGHEFIPIPLYSNVEVKGLLELYANNKRLVP